LKAGLLEKISDTIIRQTFTYRDDADSFFFMLGLLSNGPSTTSEAVAKSLDIGFCILIRSLNDIVGFNVVPVAADDHLMVTAKI
jgi:hypothetical protein